MMDEWRVIIGKEQSIQPLGRDNELNIQRSAKLYDRRNEPGNYIPLLEAMATEK